MENFEVAAHEYFKYNKEITGECVKPSVEDSVCCFLTNSDKLIICEYDEDLKTFLLEDNVSNIAIQLKYINQWQVIFIATKSNLLIYEPRIDELRVIHSFTPSITEASWNPNETFLVVVDEGNMLYGFTLEVDQTSQQYHLFESHSSALDEPVPNSMYVGWGSQTTQFKGVKKEQAEKVEEVLQEYSPPTISWRGNGEEFVINFWKESKRYLKVYDNNLRPLFQSDFYPNLLAPTAFKGKGNSIACAALHNEENKIVIFEKNCRMKSEFFVPNNKGLVKCLKYHPDMHILAVYSEDSSSTGYLNIYVYFCAEWLLKQQLIYPSSKSLLSFHWSTFLDKTMCTLNVLTSESVDRILFRIAISSFTVNQLVALVDGGTVYFTMFGGQIKPPPMSTFLKRFEKPVNRIFFDPTESLFQFLCSDNSLHPYYYENDRLTPHPGINVPQLNLDVNNSYSNIVYNTDTIVDNIRYEFLLDRKQDLLINRSVVYSNVLSIYVHENYFLFTHASCKLYCVRITPENMFNPDWNRNKFYCREVEQGSKIVCVNSNSDIILVLPRGNLETICCRVIAIDSVEQLLEQNKWEEAINQMRQQRLNWNLLIDLNRQRFSEHIMDFISAAKTISVLNSILSEFSNENCLQSMYSQCIEFEAPFFEFDKTPVFSLILHQLLHLGPVRNLVSIVTLQAKHFSLKSALKSVCFVFDLGHFEICKKAVHQILLYSHAKNIISEAYTIYNIGFMTFIFTCCSEDPRIFEPELERLKALDPIELRFQMNVLGRNFKGATKYLIRCTNVDHKYISDFITKNLTQSTAYESIDSKHPNFQLVSHLFANYLSLRAQHNEAGIILERAELYNEALQEFKKALNLHRVVGVLTRLNIDEKSRWELFSSLAGDMANQKRIEEAVLIYEYYCLVPMKAIGVFLENKMFQRALCLARKYDITDELDPVIKADIVKYRIELFDRVAELGNMFVTYTSRLLSVRQNKIHTLKHRYLEGEDAFENDDLLSEYGSIISSRASSVDSRSSRRSTLSSRNRRKQEKKKIDLREGSVFEDIALIRQLYLLVVDIFKLGEDVREICMSLTDDLSFEQSKLLHEKLCTVQNIVRTNIPMIWSDTFLNAPESTEPEILAIVQNRNELDVEFRNPPSADKLADDWKLLVFNTM